MHAELNSLWPKAKLYFRFGTIFPINPGHTKFAVSLPLGGFGPLDLIQPMIGNEAK